MGQVSRPVGFALVTPPVFEPVGKREYRGFLYGSNEAKEYETELKDLKAKKKKPAFKMK